MNVAMSPKAALDTARGVQEGARVLYRPEQLAEVKERMHSYTPAQLFGDRVGSSTGQFWTISDVCHGLQQWYGVIYNSSVSYRAVMDRCGFSYQRTERTYRSRSEMAAAQFEEEIEKN